MADIRIGHAFRPDEKRLVLGLSDPTGDFLCRRRAESLAVFRVIPLVFHDLAPQCFAYSHGKLILGPLRQRAIWEGGLADTKVGTFAQALYVEAKKDGWMIVSMKNDWKRSVALPKSPPR